MKARIQEALRRRHRKGDEGFTLIELLVVILIIAILAAVGIVALLSALSSGKKSAAKTTMRNAITAVKAVQTGLGSQDFTGISVGAVSNPPQAGELADQEPDLTWTNAVLTTAQTTNFVGVPVLTANRIVLVTRSSNGDCFYTNLDQSLATGYASMHTATAAAACPAAPAAPTAAAPPSAANAWVTATWFKSQTVGWAAG